MKIDVVQVGRQRAEMEAHLQRLGKASPKSTPSGCRSRIGSRLLDFPFRLDDEVVLCWRTGRPPSSTGIPLIPGFKGADLSTSAFAPLGFRWRPN